MLNDSPIIGIINSYSLFVSIILLTTTNYFAIFLAKQHQQTRNDIHMFAP